MKQENSGLKMIRTIETRKKNSISLSTENIEIVWIKHSYAKEQFKEILKERNQNLSHIKNKNKNETNYWLEAGGD